MRKTFIAVYKDRHEGLGVYEFNTLLDQAIELKSYLKDAYENLDLVANLEIREDGTIIRHKDLCITASSVEEEV